MGAPFLLGGFSSARSPNVMQLHCQPELHLPLGAGSPRPPQIFRNERRSAQRDPGILLRAHWLVIAEEAPGREDGGEANGHVGLDEGPRRCFSAKAGSFLCAVHVLLRSREDLHLVG